MSTSGQKKKNSAKNQSNFIRFMVLTGLGGLTILLLMFGLFFSMMTKNDKSDKPSSENQSSLQEKASLENQETGEIVEMIGIITKDVGADTVEVLNIENEKKEVLKIENGTEMKDIYGNSMSLKEFKVGDMIQTKYDKGSKIPKFFRISGETWEQKHIKNVKIDKESKTIEIGNNIYGYTEDLISMYKNAPVSLDKIDPVDEIMLKGYKNKVWFTNIEVSHGYISIAASDEEKGIVEIDNNVSLEIKEVKNVPVSEGPHKIVIKKEGYEPVVKNVQVESMETLQLDLGEMKKKVGQLQVTAKDSTDYKVFINDVEYPANESILLEYGDYHILVKKEGYKDWNSDFKMNEKTKVMNVDLQKEEIPKGIKVSIDTNPTGAEVYVDDTFMGVAPIEELVPYGEHKISLIKEGYSPLHIPISIDETQKERNLLYTLQKAAGGEIQQN